MAGVQSAPLNTYNTLGFPGDIAFGTPWRSTPYNLNSAGQAQTFGFAFTVQNGGNPDPVGAAPVAGLAKVGGLANAVFAGILVNPKEHVTAGISGNALAPNLNLPDNSVGALCNEGDVYVQLGNTANIGDQCYFDATTGAIGSLAPNSAFTGVIASNVLTVSGYVAGGAPLAVGSQIFGANILTPTFISVLGTGTGGNGTYTVTGQATAASSAMSSNAIAPAGKVIFPGKVARYDVAAAGVAVIHIGA